MPINLVSPEKLGPLFAVNVEIDGIFNQFYQVLEIVTFPTDFKVFVSINSADFIL